MMIIDSLCPWLEFLVLKLFFSLSRYVRYFGVIKQTHPQVQAGAQANASSMFEPGTDASTAVLSHPQPLRQIFNLSL